MFLQSSGGKSAESVSLTMQSQSGCFWAALPSGYTEENPDGNCVHFGVGLLPQKIPHANRCSVSVDLTNFQNEEIRKS